MRPKHMLMATALLAFAAAPAAAGSIGGGEVGESLEWRSSCTVPQQPSLYLDDIESYNVALAQYNSYVAQVRSYISCVQGEGSRDIEALSAVVAKSMKAAQDAAIGRAEEMRTELEVQRNLLQ